MNAFDRKTCAEFPSNLDDIVNEQFPGAECSSGFSIVEMTHVTTWKEGHENASEIKAFIQGFMAGRQNLSETLIEGGAK